MPEYRFAGPVPYDYPASRDAKGAPLGTVEPGATQDLDEAPDWWWVPAGDGGGGGSTEPAGPQPAPPAAIPQPTDEAGVTGSEEN
jgi:hypothetical protein